MPAELSSNTGAVVQDIMEVIESIWDAIEDHKAVAEKVSAAWKEEAVAQQSIVEECAADETLQRMQTQEVGTLVSRFVIMEYVYCVPYPILVAQSQSCSDFSFPKDGLATTDSHFPCIHAMFPVQSEVRLATCSHSQWLNHTILTFLQPWH